MMNKDEAVEQGLKTYEGSPCKKCGGTTRYMSGGCTRCAIHREQLTKERDPEGYKIKKRVASQKYLLKKKNERALISEEALKLAAMTAERKARLTLVAGTSVEERQLEIVELLREISKKLSDLLIKGTN